MEVAIFSSHKFDKSYLEKYIPNHKLRLFGTQLNIDTAGLAQGCEAASIFVNDDGSAPVLSKLKEVGVRFLALRSTGYNHVDITAATKLGLKVARVPDYSPSAIAEHAVALILALNRKLIKAHNRIRDLNFSLDGLIGFDMNGKVIGIVGMGKIGCAFARIMHGFGCPILASDLIEDEEQKIIHNVKYVGLDELCKTADVISLHVPLTATTKNLISKEYINTMKKGVMLINTSRGGLVNNTDIINGLKSGQIGFFGMDVYEEEQGLFFDDHSDDILQDDVIARLMSFQNVLITGHQAFFTHEALIKIAEATKYNLDCWAAGIDLVNELK